MNKIKKLWYRLKGKTEKEIDYLDVVDFINSCTDRSLIPVELTLTLHKDKNFTTQEVEDFIRTFTNYCSYRYFIENSGGYPYDSDEIVFFKYYDNDLTFPDEVNRDYVAIDGFIKDHFGKYKYNISPLHFNNLRIYDKKFKAKWL